MSSLVHQLVENVENLDTIDIAGDFSIDWGVLRVLPQGSKVLSANRYGTSAWTVIARLDVEITSEGKQETRYYFLKCATEAAGHRLMEGEYNAMRALFQTMPDFVPEPYAFGQYDMEEPETYFFLSKFVDMSNKMPNPKQLCMKLAQLHRTSKSPEDKFGFHITTCQGRIDQNVGWESSWTTFFTKLLQHVVNLDFECNGSWDELKQLEDRLISHVVPRLVGNLERNGRTVTPSLIHGDLWEGNTGTEYGTGNVFIFDTAAYYAHHEMEVANWRCHYNKIHNKVYTKTYLRYHAPSEPKEEWDDRNRIYCVYYNIIYSVNHLNQGTAVRQTAYDDMYYLIDKYSPFEQGEGPPRLKESDKATLSAERDHTTEA